MIYLIVGIVLMQPIKILGEYNLEFVITNISGFQSLHFNRVSENEDFTNTSTAASIDKDNLLNLNGVIRTKMAMRTMLDEPLLDVVCSPMSLLTPLAELAVGCRQNSQTLRELEKAMGFNRSEIYTEINRIKHDIVSQDLKLATQLFLSNKYTLQQTFKEEIARFHSEVRPLDVFRREKAADFINDWVRKETNNLVKRISLPTVIDFNVMLLLVSSIYFQGQWMNPFLKDSTKEVFHSPVGPIDIEMMYQTAEMLYAENDILDVKAVRIPLVNRFVSFVIILPNQKTGLTDVLKKLNEDPSMINKILVDAKPTLLDLKIPHFKSATLLNVKVLLKELGVHNIFDPKEGIPDLAKEINVYLTKALQWAYVEINEVGISVSPSSLSDSHIMPKRSLRTVTQSLFVNHPFAYYISALGETILFGIYNGRRMGKNVKDVKIKRNNKNKKNKNNNKIHRH